MKTKQEKAEKLNAKIENLSNLREFIGSGGMIHKVEAGEYEPEMLRLKWRFFREQEAKTKEQLAKLTKDELANYANPHRTASDSKATFISSAFDRLATAFAYDGSVAVGYFGRDRKEGENPFLDAIEKQVLAVTPEDVEKKKAEYLEAQEARKARQEAFRNPQTLENFEMAVQYRNLSREEKERFAILKAPKTKAELVAKRDEKRTAEAVDVESEGGQFRIETGTHTKKDCTIYIAKLSVRVEKSTYRELNARAKKCGGYYSRFSQGFIFDTMENAEEFTGNESITKEEDTTGKAERLAEKAEGMSEKAQEALNADRKTNTAKRAREAGYALQKAESLETLAGSMARIAESIADGSAVYLDRVTNRVDVEVLELGLRRAMQNYATEESKTGPDSYENLMSQDWVEDCIKWAVLPMPYISKSIAREIGEAVRSVRGMKQKATWFLDIIKESKKPDEGHESLLYFRNSETVEKIMREAVALDARKWQAELYLEKRQDEKRLQRLEIHTPELWREAIREYFHRREKVAPGNPIQKAELDLVGTKIPGFFPTPKSLGELILDKTGWRDIGNRWVLEPSAGKGDLADVIRERMPNKNHYKLQCVEINRKLADICEMKGHRVACSSIEEFRRPKIGGSNVDCFTKEEIEKTGFELVVMNPPFEKGQDMDHVQECFEMLRKGGELVAIVSAGVQFRQDKKTQEFRDWVDAQGGTIEDLPAGSFKTSEAFRQTGVNVALVHICN